jgi:D-alanyl-D-alanine carboxypeptidase
VNSRGLDQAVVAVLMVTSVIAAGCGGAVQSRASPTPLPATTVRPVRVSGAALNAIAQRYRTSCRSPGAAIGVRTSDGMDHFALAGVLAPKVALTVQSQFLAGSVTKLFVAAVAYELIDDHRLAQTDAVDQYVPNWPRGDRITIAMLLGHRSGMGDFGNDFSAALRDLVLADPSRVFRYDEVLDLVRAVPPVAEPGAVYHYSNANYIVLGAILQRVSHVSLGEMVRTRVIGPLRLTHTIYGPDDLAAADRVVLHGLFDIMGTGHPIDIGAFPREAALTVDPAGAGLFSTLPDLLEVTHALFGTDAVLPARSRAALAASVSTLTANDLLLGDHFVIHGHGGASPGAQTIVAYDATSQATVAVWCNRLDPGASELLPSVLAAHDVFTLVAAARSAREKR